MEYKTILTRFTEMCRQILGENLTGVYLHGSAAMGCFNPIKSDLDLLIVVEEGISKETKLAFMKQVVSLNEEAPTKGIEMSIVQRSVCAPFVYPTPFELHFSPTHLNWFREDPLDYIEKMNGTDPDLAAHFTITRKYGKILYGEEIHKVFGSVPKADYIDSIWLDVAHAREDILDNPVYVMLNLCRVLAYLKEERILSKQAGGEWGLKSLPEEFHGLIVDALVQYGSCERDISVIQNGKDDSEQDGTERSQEKSFIRIKGNESIESATLSAYRFADYMLGEIREYRAELLNARTYAMPVGTIREKDVQKDQEHYKFVEEEGYCS